MTLTLLTTPLPPLKKQRLHTEADITPLIMKWFKNNFSFSCAVEIKIKGNKPKPHQATSLKQVADGYFAWKIPDKGGRNPFDFFQLYNAIAFVVTYDKTTRICYAEEVSSRSIPLKFTFKI